MILGGKEKAKSVSPAYVVGNFHSGYVFPVHGEARTILHAGEIDAALHSLAREGIESVVAVDLNQTSTAFGLWKKEAIQQLDRIEYAVLLSIVTGVPFKKSGFISKPFDKRLPIPEDGFLRKKFEQLRPNARNMNRRIIQNLPSSAQRTLENFFEAGMPARVDNGLITNLQYIESGLYERVKDRLGKLDVQTGDVFEALPTSEVFDLISINNIIDYVAGDVSEKLRLLAGSLKPDGRLVIASTKFDHLSDIRLYEQKNGEIWAFGVRNNNVPTGKPIYLSAYLQTLGLQQSDDGIVTWRNVRKAWGGPITPLANANSLRRLSEEELRQLASVRSQLELESVYPDLARRSYKRHYRFDAEEPRSMLERIQGIIPGETRRKRQLRRGSVQDMQEYVGLSLKFLLENAACEAEQLGIGMFNESDRLFACRVERTPAQLISEYAFFGDMAVMDVRARVEVYKRGKI